MKKLNSNLLLLVLLLLASILLCIGLTAPMITFKKFIFIQNTFSILTATWELLKEGQWFLFFIIGLFSIVFPIVKIILLAQLILNNHSPSPLSKSILNKLHQFGQWSMLDVFVVAVLVVTVKLGAIASVEQQFGLYAYAFAAILIMVITHLVMKNHATKN